MKVVDCLRSISGILLVLVFCLALGGTCSAAEVLDSSETVEISKADLQTWKNSIKTLKTNNAYLQNALNESNPALARVSEQLAQSEQKLAESEKRCKELEALLTEYDKEARNAIEGSKKMTEQLRNANLSLQELKKQTVSEIKKLEVEKNVLLAYTIYKMFKK